MALAVVRFGGGGRYQAKRAAEGARQGEELYCTVYRGCELMWRFTIMPDAHPLAVSTRTSAAVGSPCGLEL